ncbi:hypothetical protein AB0H36_00465 [Kribbella sp. NPDC050820]|uniref:hypothetical protein n=1 Tax=Kribbella sp. NPDC050820 TaxID=3155408 RepID=UPI003404601C
MADTDDARDEELEELREEEELEEDLRDDEETFELAAKDQQELHRVRREAEEDARLETHQALRLAYADEAKADRLRTDAAGKYQQGLSDRAHGRHLLDEAAARPDEPGADATAAAGRRYERAAGREEREARYDRARADEYDADARDRRNDAAQQSGQPPAEEAARRPSEPPVASKFERRKPKHDKRKDRRPGELRNIGLGDD